MGSSGGDSVRDRGCSGLFGMFGDLLVGEPVGRGSKVDAGERQGEKPKSENRMHLWIYSILFECIGGSKSCTPEPRPKA